MTKTPQVKQRNADYQRIMETIVSSIPSNWKAAHTKLERRKIGVTLSTRKVKARSDMRREKDIPLDAVIFFGDLNYRVEQPRPVIVSLHNTILKKTAPFVERNNLAASALRKRASKQRTADASDGRKPASVLEQATARNSSYFRHLPPGEVRTALENRLDRLLRSDQLNQQRSLGRAFKGFQEGNIRFPPTYKYDKNANQFDTSSKRRCPAWTDRILFYTRSEDAKSRSERVLGSAVQELSEGLSDLSGTIADRFRDSVGDHSIADMHSKVSKNTETRAPTEPERAKVELLEYYSVDARTSDHRPVCASFRVNF